MDNMEMRLGVSLAIGLLVGVERAWRGRHQADGQRVAGIRTFGLAGFLGGLTAVLALAMNEMSILAVGILSFSAIFGSFYWREYQQTQQYSVTAVVAACCVYVLGALAVAGDYQLAVAGAAALAGLLASRELLHQLISKLSWEEVRSALMLVVMTVVILPLLPNEPIDPWQGFNPWEVWLFTVLMAGISYVGYISARWLGPARGFMASGLAGALVSSTAVTIAFARAARANASAKRQLAGGAILAAMVSLGRVTVVVGLLRADAWFAMAPMAIGAMLVLATIGWWLASNHQNVEQTAELPKNPFELLPLLGFAVAFAVVSTIMAILSNYVTSSGLVLSFAISGALDVDIAVLSALRLSEQGIEPMLIANAILAAVVANGFVRVALAASIGPREFWMPLLLATLLAVGAGLAVFSLVSASTMLLEVL